MPNRTVIFDIDGVLSDNWPRLTKYIHADKDNPDWESFYAELHLDDVLEGWAALLRTLWGHSHIVLLTNRPEQYRQQTREWLAAQSLPYDELRMRDGAHYNESKRSHVTEMMESGYDIRFAIDDDPHHETVYMELGVPFIYAHSGYYEHGRIDDNKIMKA